MPAVTQPAPRGVEHVGRRRGVDPFEIGLDEQRVSRVELALGERRRLSAEAADLLQAANDRRVDARDDSLELLDGRPGAQELRHDAVDRLGADGGRLTRIQYDRQVENARE